MVKKEKTHFGFAFCHKFQRNFLCVEILFVVNRLNRGISSIPFLLYQQGHRDLKDIYKEFVSLKGQHLCQKFCVHFDKDLKEFS